MPDFLYEARCMAERIMGLRRDLHQCPETGNREFATARLLMTEMRQAGLPCRGYQTTAFSAELAGALPGKTVALRADMDALPIVERTDLPFVSRNDGMMHACGHDIHMASAVGAAWLLCAHRDALHGRVRFLFQPDEEGRGGARAMIAAGCLEPNVAAVYGGHVSPDLPLGSVGIRYGAFYAASVPFSVTVCGKACHAAMPERGIDALCCAAEMISALDHLPSSVCGEPFVLRVCTARAGHSENILADQAVFSGILRTFGEAARDRMKRVLCDTVQTTAQLYSAAVSVSFGDGYSGVVNDEACAEQAEKSARKLLGGIHVHHLVSPTMATEDFGEFISACSGCFVHIGVGGDAPLHSAEFAPDGEAAVLGAAFFAQLLWDALQNDAENRTQAPS